MSMRKNSRYIKIAALIALVSTAVYAAMTFDPDTQPLVTLGPYSLKSDDLATTDNRAYRPWYGPHYYPRPWTWGVNVRYDPWYGWGFGISYSNGPFTISFGNWGYRGGYRPPYYLSLIHISEPTRL